MKSNPVNVIRESIKINFAKKQTTESLNKLLDLRLLCHRHVVVI